MYFTEFPSYRSRFLRVSFDPFFELFWKQRESINGFLAILSVSGTIETTSLVYIISILIENDAN